MTPLEEEHVEVPVPLAQKNELLLKLEAASINPVDWKIQKGILRPFLPRKLPFIPVMDVAGVVADVGPGVNGFQAGDQVVVKLYSLNGGGLAEYAVAPETLTVKRPPDVFAAEGAGLPVAAGTALQALRTIGAKFDGTGKPLNVLITAASGGVGHYAVQLAKLAGLHITATCGARNMELVKSLGADEVLDYNRRWSTFEPVLATTGRVIDVTPNFTSILKWALHKVTFARKRLVPLHLSPNKADLEFLVGLLKDGKLKTLIDSKFPLSEVSKAWQKSIEGHATGKIIVEMGR
uniref:Polyketide synthase, enoylreductase n=1 Tax=Saccharum hybrid cultivar R570 TaxID=131158 RepID=A0A059Q390_9POAL|nr:Polyketide synthase, enoylreductase [Saccharum hybrid cultivar R570]